MSKKLLGDPQVERAFLTALLMGAEMPFESFLDLPEAVFVSRKHQLVWRLMRQVNAAQQPVVFTTVNSALGDLEPDGENPDTPFLYELAVGERTILQDQAYEFADVLRGYHAKRQMRGVLAKLDQLIDTNAPVGQVAQAGIESILGIARGTDDHRWESLEEVLAHAQEELNQREAGFTDLFPTGFYELDNVLKGFKTKSVNFVAGRPGSGKSALMAAMALNIASWLQMNERDGCVGYITMEMSSTDIAARLVTGSSKLYDPKRPAKVTLPGDILRTGFRTGDFASGNPGPIDEAAKRFWREGKRFQTLHAGKRLFFFDHTLDSRGIVQRALQLKREHGLQVLFLDYLDLVADPRKSSNADRLADISRAMMQLANEHDIALVVGVQLNRESLKSTDRRPDLEHMGGSDNIGRDGWTVTAVHRPMQHFPFSETEDAPFMSIRSHYDYYAEAMVLKNRNGGTGTVPLLFQGEATAFRDWPALWNGTLDPGDGTLPPGDLLQLIRIKDGTTPRKAVA